MRAIIDRLQALSPAITNILSTSGTVGESIGVLNHGEVIYTKGFGYRDIDRRLPMNEETVVSLFSLTKAMAASAVSVLVSEGTTTFDTPLVEIIPDFRHHDPTIQSETTLRDLLTHRVGWAQYNAIWMQDQGRLYLDKNQSLITAATLPVTAGFREKFQYNN
ncbi:beta-lactamase/transpeptidase-like protein [Melanomma pulvis-pyrius CBS 109.77]|uniref:Beta-lactamase/transpeptidase-like protein n=1 Tax=Melanomma pulvis-pyrius CBS 109.77 TaxID=1314802 RepID=A0A6A6X4P2_9PLEO|nr:beta-lactamase/transpeptidase-like protein [Melanomma pulvis-pyrius CBS 109.77]